ncbi:MAG TPA: tetratricopeptide repeat protein, partial [Flavobacteriales bacterium]|nr:tetratricopeptide repeat protein [Flavobacteriales bacterium]
MLRSITLSVLAVLAVLVHGQSANAPTDVPFDSDHFSDGAGLKAALAAIKQGDAAFRQGGKGFAEAITHYEKAYAFNPDNAELDLKMGLCHLNGQQRAQGLPYFQKVVAIDPETPRIHFYLGYSYQLNARWDEAMAEFQLQRTITTLTPDPDRAYNLADKHIAECKYGKGLQAKPGRATVTALAEGVNSDVADYGVLASPDGKQLLLTSRRSNSTGGKVNKTTNEFFEDIYACTATSSSWSTPAPMAAPVNTAMNDACVGLFDGGNSLLIYRDAKGAGDLYESVRTGDTWSEPKPFNANVNSTANETSAWFSADR